MAFSKGGVFFLLAFLSGSLVIDEGRCQPVAAIAISDGSPTRTFVLNNAGTVVFATGPNFNSADQIVLADSNRSLKIASAGDAVPGFPNKVFINFLSGFWDNPSGLLGLNDLDEVAFSAAFMECPDAPDVYKCSNRGTPFSYGLFVYSEGRISKTLATGDTAPDAGGRVFYSIEQLWLNNRHEVLFLAYLKPADTSYPSVPPPSPPITYSAGLFIYSAGRVQKVALREDPSPLGGPFFFFPNQFTIVFNDEGTVTFVALGGVGLTSRLGVFHYSNGTFITDVATGGTFRNIYAVAANGEGDVAFGASFGFAPSDQGLFLRRKDGKVVRILADGDPSPLGGTFSLWHLESGMFHTTSYASNLISPPKINKSGDVLFALPIKDAAVSGALFLYTPNGIKTVVANGDPAPPKTNANLVFFKSLNPTQPPLPVSLRYTMNDAGTIAFRSELSTGPLALLQVMDGKITKVAAVGDVAPAEYSSFAGDFSPLVENSRGEIAFQSRLCCDRFPEGIFLWPGPLVVNGDFELPGDNGLPAGWPIVWHESGTGDVFRYDSGGKDAMKGTSVLRLHVNPGGGSIYVLSDEMPVLPSTNYVLTGWMRYSLASEEDYVSLSVIQLDAAGNIVGFDEVRGVKGDNYWQWVPKRVLIRTSSTASTIRVRVGLVSATESYLDVDDVR
jgi:hypothetical protein